MYNIKVTECGETGDTGVLGIRRWGWERREERRPAGGGGAGASETEVGEREGRERGG